MLAGIQPPPCWGMQTQTKALKAPTQSPPVHSQMGDAHPGGAVSHALPAAISHSLLCWPVTRGSSGALVHFWI